MPLCYTRDVMRRSAVKVTSDRSGDPAQWLQRHGEALRQYFRRRVNPADVDDLVQEVLIKLQTAAAGSDVVGTERYIFTVARNVLFDRHRSDRTCDLEGFETYTRITGEADPISPERILLARDEFARISAAIRRLPPRARAAFEFQRFEQMTYREVARTMGISHESVKELMHRALVAIAAEVPHTDTGDD